MPADRRTKLALAALAVVAAIGAWTWFGPGSAPAPQASANAPRQSGTGAAAALPKAEAMTVKLAALEGKRAEPSGSARNPFEFGARPVEAPAADPAREAVLAPSIPAPPPGPPPPPPIALKFIGTVEKADGLKLAVLTDGRTPLYGKEGDIIDGRYRILSIGTESLDIAYADGRGRQTIRLTGQ